MSEAGRVLVRCLQDRNPKIRIHAAYALCKRQDKNAIAALVPLLKDRDAEAQAVAATSLLELGDARASEQAVAYHLDLFRRWNTIYNFSPAKKSDARPKPPVVTVYNFFDSSIIVGRHAVKKGMSKEEVITMLGRPPNTTGKADHWFYPTLPSQGLGIYFENDRVTQIEGP